MGAKLIHSGFSAYATFDGEQISCTSFSIQTNTNILESQSGYGGSLNISAESADNNVGLFGPFLHDTTNVSGSISFETTFSQLSVIKAWISDRNKSKTIVFYLGSNEGGNNILTFSKCFWESITISTQSDSLVTIDLSIWAWQQEWLEIDGNLKLGGLSPKTSIGSPVGGIDSSDKLVPYWCTKIVGLPNGDIIGWSVTLSQTLVKKMYCGGKTKDDTAPLPGNVFVGALQAEFNADLIIAYTPISFKDTFMIGSTSDSIEVKYGSGSEASNTLLKLQKCAMTGLNPTLDDVHGANSVSLSYKSYLITS